jgi:hypothetical protein
VFGDKIILWFVPISTSLGDGIVYPQRGHLSESDEESGLLSGSGNHYRDESCVEELVPMIRATDHGSDDDDDEDGEWSKIDVKDFGHKNSSNHLKVRKVQAILSLNVKRQASVNSGLDALLGTLNPWTIFNQQDKTWT